MIKTDIYIKGKFGIYFNYYLYLKPLAYIKYKYGN